VFFMFATTELHKIPITILSRCQRYELTRVSTIDLGTHFQNLAKSEGVDIDQAALDLIVRESEGSVRDGLSLLDQVFSYGEKKIGVNDVIQVLGLVSRDIIVTLTRALLEKDPAAAFQALDDTFNFGVDLKRFTGDLLAAFRTLILCRINGCQDLIDIPQQELDLFKELAGKHSPDIIHMKLNLLMQGVEEMRYSSQPRLALESTFLKIIQADDVVPVSSLLSKLDTLLEGKELPQKTVLPAPPEKKKSRELSKETPEVPPVPDKQAEIPPPKISVPITNLADTTPPPAEEPPLPPEPEHPVPPPQNSKPTPHPHQRDVRRDWPGFIEHVKDRKVWMAQDLGRADKAREVDGELQLHFSDHANCAVLRQKQNVKLLTEFVLDFFQKDLKLHFITPDKEEGGTSDNADSPHKLRQKLANDPLVIMATEIFSGQIGNIRVGPRSR
jgi:DNA polymerase-3 subunit gamma/tau